MPSGPSGALHVGGAVSLACGWVRRLEARPGPDVAHRHRGQAPPSRRTRIERSLPTFLSPHPISHAIPPRPFRILK